jgi:hypothetical protein
MAYVSSAGEFRLVEAQRDATGRESPLTALQVARKRYAASREALNVAIGSVSFEERGDAASGLLSLTNPASHKACRSALNRTFRYSGVFLRPR